MLINRLEVSEAYKTLGICISPEGGQREEIRYLTNKSRIWSAHINANNLFPWEMEKAYNQVLLPAIIYPSPCLSLTEQECYEIQKESLPIYISSQGFSRSTYRAITHENRLFAFICDDHTLLLFAKYLISSRCPPSGVIYITSVL